MMGQRKENSTWEAKEGMIIKTWYTDKTQQK